MPFREVGRLLRHDLVASLSTSALQFSEAGGVRSLQRANHRGGRFAARGAGGRDEIMMFVYRNVRIEAVRFARHAGAFFQVSLNPTPLNPWYLSIQLSKPLNHRTLKP